jgi:hypothetical protein
MARYYFHVQDGVRAIDHTGTELDGADEARGMAVLAAGEALKDLGAGFWDSPEWRMWVTDEDGATICAFRFSPETNDSDGATPRKDPGSLHVSA